MKLFSFLLIAALLKGLGSGMEVAGDLAVHNQADKERDAELNDNDHEPIHYAKLSAPIF